jgi:hypothetical protein
VADPDAPGLEAHFIRMKEAVAGQLTRLSLVGAVVDNLHQKQWETRRTGALAALGEAALKACLKDRDLKARLLPRVAAGDRAKVRALFAGELDSPVEPHAGAAVPAPASTTSAAPAQGDPRPGDGADPAAWAPEDFRRYLREHKPRNRTALRQLNGAVYRQLQKHHPALLEELLPTRKAPAGRKRAAAAGKRAAAKS